MLEETNTQSVAGTVEAPAPEDTRTEAQKKAAEILAARAKGKPASTPTVTEPSKPKEKKESKPRAPSVMGGSIGFRFLRDLDPTVDKLNRQQGVLMEALLKLRKTEGPLKDVVLRKELLEVVTADSLNSRQPVERVLGFYMTGWKKDIEATDKKPAIPALFEIVRLVEATPAPVQAEASVEAQA